MTTAALGAFWVKRAVVATSAEGVAAELLLLDVLLEVEDEFPPSFLSYLPVAASIERSTISMTKPAEIPAIMAKIKRQTIKITRTIFVKMNAYNYHNSFA